MMRLTSERRGPLARLTGDGWGERSFLSRREHDEGPPVGWLVTGAVVIGLGVLAWHYFGPEMRRYIKINNM